MIVGEKILGYTVEECIGTGGYGTVYKVSKTNASGTYIRALKHITIPNQKQYFEILNSMGGDYEKTDEYFEGVLRDIVNEIQIISKLSEHGAENIVRYYENEICETDSPKKYDIYILMEYLTPFTDYLDEHDLQVQDVISLGKDILSALASCHSQNVMHRDIKEDNIFVSKDGKFKLGDFGVAKALNNQSRAESIKGTLSYIAPEVYLGKEQYDKTVDLYSLGIVLYKLLNKSRIPFLPSYPNTYSSVDEDTAFERRMRFDLPELPCDCNNQLGKVILKALKKREDRYGNAEEFLKEIIRVEKKLGEKEKQLVVNKALNCSKTWTKNIVEQSVDKQKTSIEVVKKNEGEKKPDKSFLDDGIGVLDSQTVVDEELKNPIVTTKETRDKKKLVIFLGIGSILAICIVMGVVSVLSTRNTNTIENVPNTEILLETESEGVTETEIETETEIQVFLLKEYVGDYIEIAQRELEERGIIVRVMESESAEYEKGRIIEQSLSQNTEMHANMEITFLVSSGKIEEDITNEEKIEKPSYKENNTLSENAGIAVEEPVQQTPEEPVVQEPVVISLGTYGESNVLSSGSISVIRNSVISNCSGNIDAEKENLAKYMSANGCSNASTTYSSLTNGGNVNWNAKVCTVQLESDTNEQLEDACMSVVSQIGTVSGSVGIGISSFQNEQVGYRIVVVVVY